MMTVKNGRRELRYYTFFGFIFMCLFSCCWVTVVKADRDDNKRVLFISSYDYSWATVPLQIQGIQSVLDDTATLSYEYMDTKSTNDDISEKNFYQSLRYRLSKVSPYDVVILGDDEALQFAMNYREELFPDIPLVFEGINDIERALEAGEDDLITGVIEEISYADNIDFAMSVNPDATKIVAILDDTITGIGERKQFYNQVENYPQLEFGEINCSKLTHKEICESLSQVGDDTILLHLTLSENRIGEKYSKRRVSSMISNYVKVPTYCLAQAGIGKGSFGGNIVSHEELGRIAATMALDIMNGENPAAIPVMTESPNFYYFDSKIIDKFGIDKNLIPKGAIIVNYEPSFFEKNAKLLITLFTVIVILAFIIILVVFDNIRRRNLTIELEIARAKLDFLAHHDFLTRLPNRRSFLEKLKSRIEQSKSCAIILFDIDNFKRINDTLGHVVGDTVLVEVAERLLKKENEHMKIYRFAGDEFMALVDTNEMERINCYVKQIQDIFEIPFELEDKDYVIHPSIGISMYPQDAKNATELLSLADAAMYSVKNRGKNASVYYHKNMQSELKSSLQIEHILKEAINHEGFRILYQPQVDVKTGKIVSFEALLRLKIFYIAPSEFIPVAEETDLIIQIGRIVVVKVIQQLHEFQKKGLKLKPIAINFSNKQLSDHKFVSFVEETLNYYGIEGKYIEIEITESIFMKKNQGVMDFLQCIRNLNIRLALDDFGTGYSSINYLTDIPFNKIKLDKSLIERFLAIDNNTTMSKLIDLIHSLKLEVTAEGIERMDQFELMRQYECDYVQGYVFAKPMPAKKIEEIYDYNYLK